MFGDEEREQTSKEDESVEMDEENMFQDSWESDEKHSKYIERETEEDSVKAEYVEKDDFKSELDSYDEAGSDDEAGLDDEVGSDTDDDSDTGSEDEIYEVSSRTRRTKRPMYTKKEDRSIIKYLKVTGGLSFIRGDLVWKRMEKDENVAPGRTWQSLKERFKKRILKNLRKKDLAMMERKDKENKNISSEEEEGTPRKPYSETEDQKILAYINENGLEKKVGGVKMWRQMEERRVLKRSAQSMKERYRKRIKPSFDDPLSASPSSAILYNPDSPARQRSPSSPTRFRVFYQTSARSNSADKPNSRSHSPDLLNSRSHSPDLPNSRSHSPDIPNSRSNSPDLPNSRRRSPCNQTSRSHSPFNSTSNKNSACNVFLTSDLLNTSTSQVVSLNS